MRSIVKRIFRTLMPAAVALLTLTGCNDDNRWKDNPNSLLSKPEINEEIALKVERLNQFMDREKLDGMLFTQVRNVYWITAGTANTQIVLNKDVGAASLLIMRNGEKYLICSGSEAGRLMDGGLRELGYQLKQYNWYEANKLKDTRGSIIEEIAGNGRIGSDIEFPTTILKSEEFTPLRFSLTPTELKRYRWLGHETTEAMVEVCRNIKPGMNEFEIEYLTDKALRSRGIFPTVLLIAVDQRIFDYRHALAGGAVLKKYAMVNVVAEKWGMPIACTRFVHFGPLSEELSHKLAACANVNACFENATVAGAKTADIFESCKEWYKANGFEGEWKMHHQGGATGYNDREYCIYPGINETIQENQAFAWNPTITGAKIEDTIIATNDGVEVITTTEKWPMISVTIDGKIYPQPGILIR